MSMSNASETALLNLLFNNVDWANIGDACRFAEQRHGGQFLRPSALVRSGRRWRGRHQRNQLHRLRSGRCCIALGGRLHGFRKSGQQHRYGAVR